MKLILIRGLPGSGKSTLAKEIVSDSTWEHYEADMYFMMNGAYVFNPSLLHRAHSWCQNEVESALYYGVNVVVSNTFTTLKELEPYFLIAKEFEIVPQIVYCQGNWQSIHNVPQETIDKMKNRWQDDVSSLYKLLEK